MNFDTEKLIEEGFTKIDFNNFNNSEIAKEPGVYLLYRRNFEAKLDGGTDTSGLLYIGCATTSTQRRLAELKYLLKNCITGNRPVLKRIKNRFKDDFEDGGNLYKYYVLYKHCPEVIEVKKSYFKRYEKRFKSLPIFNLRDR